MNTNAIHNILNILLLVQGALIGGLLQSGCIQVSVEVLNCSASWIDPTLVGWLTGATAALKIIMNVARDGFGGLWKKQPPVS